MGDDWRARVELGSEHGLAGLLDALREAVVGREARAQLGSRVAVTRDGATIFLYAGSEDGASQAADEVRSLADDHGLGATVELDRWHPLSERWEATSVALPDTESERRVESDRRDADDEAGTEAQGYAEWEVRVELPDHHEAHELAERLEAEGVALARRWRYLLIGAASEDDARALVERLRGEAPADARWQVELSEREMLDIAPWSGFSIFGGLGG